MTAEHLRSALLTFNSTHYLSVPFFVAKGFMPHRTCSTQPSRSEESRLGKPNLIQHRPEQAEEVSEATFRDQMHGGTL